MKLLNTLVCIIGLTSFSSSAKLVNAEHLDALYQGHGGEKQNWV